MPAPDWVKNRVEPLSTRDVLHYLLAAADSPHRIDQRLDLGSGDVMTYARVMQEFARAAGLKRRWVIPLPLPAATLSGIWVGLVTPLPMALTIPLVQSLKQDAVTNDKDVDQFINQPAAGMLNYVEAVTLALRREQEGAVDTTWDADFGSLEESAGALPSDPDWAGQQHRGFPQSGCPPRQRLSAVARGREHRWIKRLVLIGPWHGRSEGCGTKWSGDPG